MTHRKHGLGVIGLCLVAALGLMAFAGSAQAKGTWKHNTAAMTVFPQAVTSEKDSEDFTLLTFFGTTPVKILCKKLTVTNGLLTAEGKSTGTLEFSENCEFFLNGAVQPKCKPAEPIVANVKDLLFKHLADGKTYDLFSPAEGTTFVTLKLGTQEPGINECAAGEKAPVTGTAVIEGCKPTTPENEANGLESEVVKHLIQQSKSTTLFTATGFKNELKYGSKEATLDGSVWLKLSAAGTLSGQNWSGVGISED